MTRQWVRSVLAGVVMVMYHATPGLASCFTTLYHCFHQAAMLDSFVERTLAGLDCELLFVSCLRGYLFW